MDKKYFFNKLIILVVILFAICSFNYFLDPYGIWKENFEKQVLDTNSNYIKTKNVLNNPTKYDSFLFGSSKVGGIEVERIPNGKYYNMGYSQGVPKEWLDNIKTFLDNGIEIKNVIIALDEFSFTVNPNSHLNQPMRIPYEELDNNFKLFRTYLLRNPFDLYNRETIKAMINSYYPNSHTDILETGGSKTTYKQQEEEIKALGDEHTKADKFNTPTTFYEEDRIDKTIDEIIEIKELCKENGIELYIILNPIHITSYKANEELILKVKEELSKVTEFYDFAVINELTQNNYYWLETLHYRYIVGRYMIDSIFK